MPHLTPAEASQWVDVASKILTLATSIFAAWQAHRANRNSKAAVSQSTQNGAKLEEVHAQVNGRMSEVIGKIPDIGNAEFPHENTSEKEQVSTYTNPPASPIITVREDIPP